MNTICACGCGEVIPFKPHHRRNPPKFIHGHNRRGERSGAWKGGRFQKDGYWHIWSPDHPNADMKGYVREHRLVWERTHGRLLESWEHIHHIDGERGNNAPENLELMHRDQHIRHHARADSKRRSDLRKKEWSDPAIRAKRIAGVSQPHKKNR